MSVEKKAVEVASLLSHFVNANSRDDLKTLAKEITGDHRTLQQATMLLFMECIDIWANDHESGNFDMRNEMTCKASAAIRDHLDGYIGAAPAIWVAGQPFLPTI